MPVIPLDPLLLHLPRDVLRLGQHLGQGWWIGGGLVRGDDRRAYTGCLQGLRDEGDGRLRIAALAQQHIDHLAVLVDGPVDIAPHTSHLHIRLIDTPPAPDRMAFAAGRLHV